MKDKEARSNFVSADDQVSCHVASTAVTDTPSSAMAAKIDLVNITINEIGWTTFHTKLFCLSGFGFAADSLVAFLQSVAAGQAYTEIGYNGYPTGSTMALYAGLQIGALFWGLGADLVGRRIAFNMTLFIASGATIVAGASPNWVAFGVFVAFLGFGAGGNLVLDPTVMLEFVPAKQQWVITAMAGWWGVGQANAGFIAWGYYSRDEWVCDSAIESCTWQNNKSWRLAMFTGGAVMLVMSLLRLFIIRLPETPKFLVASGRDEEVVEMLNKLAARHHRPCSLTIEALQACSTTVVAENRPVQLSAFPKTLQKITRNIKGLFKTKEMAFSTCLIWLSWACIGLGYPLFFLYLPSLLSNRIHGYEPSLNETWRDYTITNICSVFGPLIAAGLAEIGVLGRKYTMAIGATMTSVFFFTYPLVKTPAQNLAFSSCISICINLYYGTLYAYTAEAFPSEHRATGNGIAVALNRLMGLMSAVIAVSADTATTTPLYVSAALFIAMAIISAMFPYETYGQSAA